MPPPPQGELSQIVDFGSHLTRITKWVEKFALDHIDQTKYIHTKIDLHCNVLADRITEYNHMRKIIEQDTNRFPFSDIDIFVRFANAKALGERSKQKLENIVHGRKTKDYVNHTTGLRIRRAIVRPSSYPQKFAATNIHQILHKCARTALATTIVLDIMRMQGTPPIEQLPGEMDPEQELTYMATLLTDQLNAMKTLLRKFKNNDRNITRLAFTQARLLPLKVVCTFGGRLSELQNDETIDEKRRYELFQVMVSFTVTVGLVAKWCYRLRSKPSSMNLMLGASGALMSS
jgi:hypothetical protein